MSQQQSNNTVTTELASLQLGNQNPEKQQQQFTEEQLQQEILCETKDGDKIPVKHGWMLQSTVYQDWANQVDWGKRTLNTISLNKEAIIPRTPMPENIKFFERISIGHFDSSTLAFLRNINTLFNDVNLNLMCFGHGPAAYDYDLTNLHTMLHHISPLLHGIHSMTFDQKDIPCVEQYFAPKLAQIKMLTIYFDHNPPTIQADINFCLNWLVSEERNAAEPRLLQVYYLCAENLQQFCKAIKQQFLSAKSPCAFAIELIWYDSDYHDHIANFHLENDQLGEQLDGEIVEDGDFWIYRHKKADSARTQLQEWAGKTAEKSDKSNRIDMDGPVKFGQIDANADDNEVDERIDEEEKEKPSTSG